MALIIAHIVHRKHAGRIHAYADAGCFKTGGVYLPACVQVDVRTAALDSRAAGDIYILAARQGVHVSGFQRAACNRHRAFHVIYRRSGAPSSFRRTTGDRHRATVSISNCCS